MNDDQKLSWSQAWHPRHLSDISSLILLVANLIPLLGVFFWNWDLFLLMVLYWSETAIIGFWHILRMAIEARWFALFLVPFFCVHFGGFMAIHFLFLVVLFGKNWSSQGHITDGLLNQIFFGANLWIPFLVLFISHGISFYLNYVKPRFGQALNTENLALPSDLPKVPPMVARIQSIGSSDIMTAPYKRIIVMHLTIIFGGFISLALHADKVAFFFMVILKTVVDFGSHTRKNFKPVPQPVTAP